MSARRIRALESLAALGLLAASVGVALFGTVKAVLWAWSLLP